MTARPRVAVIIVNYRAGPLLARAVDAVARQRQRPARLVVVDNGSDDGSLHGVAARFPGLEILDPGANIGFAAANNLAVRAVDDVDWVALLNPDAFPEPDWLSRCLDLAAAHPHHASIGCRLLRADDPGRLDGTGDCYHPSGRPWRRDEGLAVADGHLADGEVFSACAAAALYRREVFLALGGFDERFFCYLEDVDLGFRLRLAGYSCGYCAGAVVHHAGSAITGRGSAFSVYHGHRNLVWTFVKNMPGPLFWVYLPWHLLLNLASIGYLALRGHGATILRAKWHALRGLPGIWHSRRALQRQRRVNWRDLQRHLERGWPGGSA